MDKYKNKYRSESHRKPNWDYSADALYFLTIVTQRRVCNLGKIVKTDRGPAEMILSDFGKIVECEWFKSFDIRKELVLHGFVLMPNHLHAIVEICNEIRGDKTDDSSNAGTQDVNTHGVDTHGRAYQPSIPIETIEPIEPIEPELPSIKRNPPIRLPKSISSFIAGFKSSVNTKIDNYIDEHQMDIPKYNKKTIFFKIIPRPYYQKSCRIPSHIKLYNPKPSKLGKRSTL
jgi:putative transposase